MSSYDNDFLTTIDRIRGGCLTQADQSPQDTQPVPLHLEEQLVGAHSIDDIYETEDLGAVTVVFKDDVRRGAEVRNRQVPGSSSPGTMLPCAFP